MIILSRKKQRKLLNLIAANQIIMNAFDTMEGFNKYEAFSQFCTNAAETIFEIGGLSALEEAKNVIFVKDACEYLTHD